MTYCNWRLVTTVAAALALGACSQQDPGVPGEGAPEGGDGGDDGGDGQTDGGDDGGDDDGGDDTGGGGESDPDSYFPLADGASWTYVHDLADGTQWTEDITMTAVDYMGIDAFAVADSPDPKGERTEAVFAVDAGTVYRIHKEVFAGTTRLMVVDYEPGFPRFDEAWLEMDLGLAEDRSYDRRESDGQGLNPLTEPRTQKYTVLGTGEAVTVPAGSFQNCVSVRRERIVGGPERTKVFTFCPGVGKVREVNETSGSIEELTAYDVPE